MLERLRAKSDLIRRIAQLNGINSVAVFGPVARGDDTKDSDIDLLIDPAAGTSLFGFAQFQIEMEQLLVRSVDIVSRRALDAAAEQPILADAVPL